MDARESNSAEVHEQALRQLTEVAQRIAVALVKIERLYASEVEALQNQRREAAEERKKWEERQKKWDEDERERKEQMSKWDVDSRNRLDQFNAKLLASVIPGMADRWQMYVFGFFIVVILLGLFKASVFYLFGYWSGT